MKLSSLVEGRDNNFNLIRILAASGVLVTHSFALAIGTPDAEPLRQSLGITFGVIAVDVFFVASGFLVTGSLLSRKSVIQFLWARALRIYPALMVMVLLTVFGIGLYFTTNTPVEYLLDRETLRYIAKNATLLVGVGYTLPGVFEGNIAGRAVNGSLWTMPYEIRMYLSLAALWIVTQFISTRGARIFKLVVVLCAAGAGAVLIFGHFYYPIRGDFVRLSFMFYAGSAYYVLKDYVRLSWRIFVPLVIALGFSTLSKEVFFVVYGLGIAYVVLFLAYVPGGLLRAYNRVGDYSYGLYIYAFPVQQSVAALLPGVSVIELLSISLAIGLAAAALSWHLLEQHALKFKNHFGRLSN
jgi:peptidoglycan/LPS O-acetylase OafA/YrhL